VTISKREANKQQCRHNILKASRRLFKEKGYEATMIEDVAEKAEISKATLYNYFSNKESLLIGTMDEEIETLKSFINELDDELSGYEKIRKIVEFLIVDSIIFISVSRRIMFLNACDNSPMYGKANEVKDILVKMSEQAKLEGDFSENTSGEEIAELLMGLYLVSLFQWDDIEKLTQQECRQRVDVMLDKILASCRS